MQENNKQNSDVKPLGDNKNTWLSRNRALKTFTFSSKRGWMKLVIGENRTNKRKFLRVKKYLNWFSIPDENSLFALQNMLKRGAKELGWAYDEKQDVKLKIVLDKNVKAEVGVKLLKDENIPSEIIDFIHEFPDFTSKLISLDLQNKDPNYVFEVIKTIGETISKSGERLKLAFKEVVEKISKVDAKGLQELSDLMEKMSLLQITSLTNLIKNRLDTIETFEQLIQDDKTYEINTDKSMHRILEKSMWVLDEHYWIVQSNKSLRTFIGNEILKLDKKHAMKRPDFACVSHGNKLIIVEIKRPSIELKKKELDQAELYHLIINKYRGTKYNSIEIYLVGNKISSEAREIVEMRKGVTIKTYSELIEDCRKRYEEYLKIVED